MSVEASLHERNQELQRQLNTATAILTHCKLYLESERRIDADRLGHPIGSGRKHLLVLIDEVLW